MRRNASLLIAAFAVLTMAGGAVAQERYYTRMPDTERTAPPHGDTGYRHQRDYRGPGWSAEIPGIIMAIPHRAPPGPFIEDGTLDEPIDHRHGRRHPTFRPVRRVTHRRSPSGAPPAGDHRYVPGEIVIEVANSLSAPRLNALQRDFRLIRLEQHRFLLTDATLVRWRIPDRRSVASVVRALEGDARVVAAQPNYRFTLQENTKEAAGIGNAAQYALAKLHLPQAHRLAKGDNVRVALIDSAVDLHNTELAGSIAGTFDTLESPREPDKHGTAIAGLIVAHGKLTGAAPHAKLLVVRAFVRNGKGAAGTTFNILKGLDWAAANRARVINMSFAGPADPALHRALLAAYEKGIVLIAAAGNAGAKSPPLYPAAEPEVVAVSATDADDRLLSLSNRGNYIAVAAPGDRILVAIPDGYELSSGTSYAAAEVSGVAALLMQRAPRLTPARLRHILEATARDLGPRGRDREFGAGLVDAYAALGAERAPLAGARRPAEHVSTGEH